MNANPTGGVPLSDEQLEALHSANTTALPPAPFKSAPWWRQLFQPTWAEEEWMKTVRYRYRRHYGASASEWEPATGALYRQRSNRTGKYRHYVRGVNGDVQIDTGTYERTGEIIYT